jgi:transcription elongation factor Elf1
MLEEDYSFSCPYCGESLSVRVEAGGGKKQAFIQDCEVCCKPIQIRVQFEGGEVTDFSAEAGD